MPKTANQWQINQGEVAIVVSAADVTALAALTTAETIVIDGVVKSFKRTGDPERNVESVRVTGDTTPIISVQDTVDHEIWELVIVDDEGGGGTGEWGTDTLTAVELIKAYYDARRAIPIKVTPAGGATGDTQHTLNNAEVIMFGKPEIDADSTSLGMRTIRFASASSTEAAHA